MDPRRNPVAAVWLGGALLTLLLYLARPGALIAMVLDAAAQLETFWDVALQWLALTSFDLLRAIALGLLAVFVALTSLAIRRGRRGRGALIAVPVLFLLLVWHAEGTHRWAEALLLAGVGALVMTRRVATPAVPQGWYRHPSAPGPV
jgi:hypothetical protein